MYIVRPSPADLIEIRNIAINVTIEFEAGSLQTNAQKIYRSLFSSFSGGIILYTELYIMYLKQ